MKKLVVAAGALLSLLAGGCASTATGDATSAMLLKNPVAFAKQPEATDVMVVVRYPAVVDQSATAAYHAAFEARAIGGAIDDTRKGLPEIQQVADSMIVKSNYFVMSIYKSLVERLPPNTVLLSPHVVKSDPATGALYTEAMTAAETLPNVLTVDFAAYSYPDPQKMMETQPLTFGDLITTMVVVHSDYAAQPATHGLLMASEPLVNVAWDNAAQASFAGVRAKRSLDLVSFLSRDANPASAVQGLSVDSQKLAVQVYGLEKIKLDSNVIEEMRTDPNAPVDVLKAEFSDSFADRVVDLLNDIDLDKASVNRRPAAVASFDQEAASLYLASAQRQDVQTRMRLAGNLIGAERQFLSKQSEKLYDGTFTGSFGKQVRETLVAEYDVIQERREIANQQNINTGLAIFTAVLAVAATASAASDYSAGYLDSASYQSLNNSASSLMSSAVQMLSYNDVLHQGSQALGENFLVSIAPALSEQVTVVTDLTGSNEAITATNFQDFHDKTRALYSSKIRSVDAVASSCAFGHPSASAGGTWNGECEGGKAQGYGSGAIRLTDETIIEYFGQAQGGVAHGVGYMIHKTGNGAVGYEGEFAAGVPHGTVKVASPGSEQEVRRFEAGKDAGKAAKNAVAPSALRAQPAAAS